MKKTPELILSIILQVLIYIGILFLEFLVIEDKAVAFIVMFVSLSLMVFLFIYIFEFGYNTNSNNYKERKKYLELKEKKVRTTFEELYFLAFQSKADDLLRDYILKEKIKQIESLDVYIDKLDEVDIFYKYKGFEVDINVREDSITYMIDSPTKYDIIDINKDFEKMRLSSILINSFLDVESFFGEMINFIKDQISTIEEYSQTNQIDPHFNGRLLQKIAKTKKWLIDLGAIHLLLAIIFIIPFVAYINSLFKEFNLGYLILLIFLAVYICCVLFNCIIFFKTVSNIKKDVQLRRTNVSIERPKKIDIVINKIHRHSPLVLCFIKLYFKDYYLFVPFDEVRYVGYNFNKKACINEMMKISRKLVYLEKSKIVISGAEEYKKIVINALDE